MYGAGVAAGAEGVAVVALSISVCGIWMINVFTQATSVAVESDLKGLNGATHNDTHSHTRTHTRNMLCAFCVILFIILFLELTLTWEQDIKNAPLPFCSHLFILMCVAFSGFAFCFYLAGRQQFN